MYFTLAKQRNLLLANYRCESLESTNVVQHINQTGYNINIKIFKLMKIVNSTRELRTYETIYTREHKYLTEKKIKPSSTEYFELRYNNISRFQLFNIVIRSKRGKGNLLNKLFYGASNILSTMFIPLRVTFYSKDVSLVPISPV